MGVNLTMNIHQFNKQLGGLLKEYRIKSKMTINELTAKTDIKTPNYLYEVERGRKGLSAKNFCLIKEALKFKKTYSIKRLILFIEIWFDQKEICEIFLNNKWLKYQIFKDNSDIERCVKIEF